MKSMPTMILELVKEENVRNPSAIKQTLIKRRFGPCYGCDNREKEEIINYELKIQASMVRMVRRGKLRFNGNAFRLAIPRNSKCSKKEAR